MSSASEATPVRLVLADDHLVLRQALKALLQQRGVQVVADEGDGRAAVDAVQRLNPDVVVLDVAMPVLNGVEAAREIGRIAPACPVILLSGLDDTRFVREALKVGVKGFVQKSQGCDDLVRAIAEVREGKSTKQIATVLAISVKTAEFHRGRLMKKLNVHDTANLVRYALRKGWIAP